MSVKIITYDFAAAAGKNILNRLKEKIESFNFQKISQSAYFIKTEIEATVLFDRLSDIVGNHADLFVGELCGEASWQQDPRLSNWLDQHL